MSYLKSKSSVLVHLAAAAFVGAIAVAVSTRHHRRERRKRKTSGQLGNDDQAIIPKLHRKESGRVADFEKFSHYFARQLGFEDGDECPNLCRVAQDYLRKSKGCELMGLFDYLGSEPESEALYLKLTEELERCILTYLAFHWNHASSIITQVLNDESQKKAQLKDLVMAATRSRRITTPQ